MEVKFNNIRYIYNKGTNFETEILRDINLDFKSGKIHTIVGKSGSGKTTILELIDGLITPTSGSVEVGKYHLDNSNKLKNI